MQKNKRETAVVTGASDGLGLAIAKKLKTDGYSVVAISRRKPEGLAYDKWLNWDLARPEDLNAELLKQELGGEVSVFIANAGMLRGLSPARYSYKDISEIQNVHVNSHIILANYILENMATQKTGRVVFVSSTAAKTGHPDVMYAATKAALMGAALSYANIYAQSGVTVNCIQPGAMRTRITKSMDGENREYLAKHTFIAGPYLVLDDVVDVIVQLTDRANKINGASLIMGDNAVWRQE